MNKNFELKVNDEVIKQLSFEVIPEFLGKISLFNLSYLYNYYENLILDSSEMISKTYHDGYKKESKRFTREVEDINDKCMKNIKRYEQMIFLIKQELEIRNVNQRFNLNIV